MKFRLVESTIIEYDSKGNALTPEQSEFFKDSKIRTYNTNALWVVYHASDSDFDTFDISRVGTGSGGLFGSGFYFTITDTNAKHYGSSVREFYLNIVNPYKFYDLDYFFILVEKVKELGYNLEEDYQNILDELDDVDFDPMDILDQIVDDDRYSSYRTQNGFTDLVKACGYDGIDSGDEIVAFSPNQIKLVSNKIPSNSDNINEDI